MLQRFDCGITIVSSSSNFEEARIMLSIRSSNLFFGNSLGDTADATPPSLIKNGPCFVTKGREIVPAKFIDIEIDPETDNFMARVREGSVQKDIPIKDVFSRREEAKASIQKAKDHLLQAN